VTRASPLRRLAASANWGQAAYGRVQGPGVAEPAVVREISDHLQSVAEGEDFNQSGGVICLDEGIFRRRASSAAIFGLQRVQIDANTRLIGGRVHALLAREEEAPIGTVRGALSAAMAVRFLGALILESRDFGVLSVTVKCSGFNPLIGCRAAGTCTSILTKYTSWNRPFSGQGCRRLAALPRVTAELSGAALPNFCAAIGQLRIH